MKRLYCATMALALLAVSSMASAQSSSNDAKSQAGAQSGASVAGVSANLYQEAGGHSYVTTKAQVPLSIVGYGSFSQNNCDNSRAVGATTRVFSFVYNAPTPSKNCEHAVRSIQYGQQSLLAHNEGKPIQSEILRAMGVWSTCTSTDEDKRACIRMGLIKYVDPQHPDINNVMPAPHFGENNQTRYVPKGIPSRPAGWTGVAGKPVSDHPPQQVASAQRPTTYQPNDDPNKPPPAWKDEPWVRGKGL